MLKFWEKYSLLTLLSKYAGALTFQNFMSLGIETVSDKGSKQQREDITLSFQAYKQICREHLWSKFGLCHIIFFLRKQQILFRIPVRVCPAHVLPPPSVCTHSRTQTNKRRCTTSSSSLYTLATSKTPPGATNTRHSR
jgi:hypothetical protein